MPELPEVETVVCDLRLLLVGKRIAGVRAGRRRLRGAWSRAWNRHLVGCRIAEVGRRGKWIIIGMDCGSLLVLHLGMTGQLQVFRSPDAVQDHTHLLFSLDRGEEQLRFRDVRRFGSAALLADSEAWDQFLVRSKLGPEPFDLQPTYWDQALSKTSRNLKAVLLDQRVVAGVGNIYADESLFAARLDPRRLGRKVDAVERARLRKAIVAVLNRAIRARGSSIRDYVDGSGRRGEYQEEFYVYGRAGEPCRRCKTPVERIRLAGRSTHYCPKCQR
jgi:formamidopyrimidine-DNA glycosylase